MKKLRSAKGLTMISLVITIIAALILTGVVLNSIMGERSVIKQASDVRTEQEKATAIEEMNLQLAGINTEVLSGGYDKDADDITAIFEGTATSEEDFKKSDGDFLKEKFDEVLYFGDYYLIGENDQYFKVKKSTDPNSNGQFYVDEYISSDLAENLPGGSYIITQKNADDADKLVFQKNSSYTVLDKISASKFNFVIPSAEGNPANAVNLYLTEDMEIDNLLTAEEKAKGMTGRSAIELMPGAILNMYISNGAEIVVNSTYGEQGQAGGQKDEDNKVIAAKGGPGGFAGIHVPESAVLNVFGDGTLIAYGGDAGDGNAVILSLGSGGGGGAGAGIGGNGGNGGDANTTEIPSDPYNFTDNGKDGEPGENCGTVNIYNSVKVYAYGGAGGSGGVASASAGSGGGGYPAAGIGGGGAGGGGGNHCDGAGGYSGGGAQYNVTNGKNGLGGGLKANNNTASTGGGGYFSCGYGRVNTYLNYAVIGGQGSGSCHWSSGSIETKWWNDHAGSGGTAGKGGTVNVSSKAKIYAYNGDMITDGNHESIYAYDKDGNKTNQLLAKVTKQNNQVIIPCQIFAQAGIKRAVYKVNYQTAANYSELKNEIISSESSIEPSKYGYGIGSGAGYIEESNGTFRIDKSMDDVQ